MGGSVEEQGISNLPENNLANAIMFGVVGMIGIAIVANDQSTAQAAETVRQSGLDKHVPISEISRDSYWGFFEAYKEMLNRDEFRGLEITVAACTPLTDAFQSSQPALKVKHVNDEQPSFTVVLKNGEQRFCSFNISAPTLESLKQGDPSAAFLPAIEGMVARGEISNTYVAPEFAGILTKEWQPAHVPSTKVMVGGNTIDSAYGQIANVNAALRS